MRKLRPLLAAAFFPLLLPRAAAADLGPDMPADCATDTVQLPAGARCVNCYYKVGDPTPVCSLNPNLSDPSPNPLDYLDADRAELGYTDKICDVTQETQYGKYRFQVWCQAESSGGCNLGRAGGAFDAGLVGLLFATAACARWARRRR
jgi:hypothetical protein